MIQPLVPIKDRVADGDIDVTNGDIWASPLDYFKFSCGGGSMKCSFDIGGLKTTMYQNTYKHGFIDTNKCGYVFNCNPLQNCGNAYMKCSYTNNKNIQPDTIYHVKTETEFLWTQWFHALFKLVIKDNEGGHVIISGVYPRWVLSKHPKFFSLWTDPYVISKTFTQLIHDNIFGIAFRKIYKPKKVQSLLGMLSDEDKSKMFKSPASFENKKLTK